MQLISWNACGRECVVSEKGNAPVGEPTGAWESAGCVNSLGLLLGGLAHIRALGALGLDLANIRALGALRLHGRGGLFLGLADIRALGALGLDLADIRAFRALHGGGLARRRLRLG